MWRNSRLTTPQKRQSDCRRLGHSRLRVASRFTLRIGLASWQTQPPSHAKIAGGPPSLGVHEPSDSPQVTSCHSGTPLCARPKLTKLSARGLCKLRAEHYWVRSIYCPKHFPLIDFPHDASHSQRHSRRNTGFREHPHRVPQRLAADIEQGVAARHPASGTPPHVQQLGPLFHKRQG